MSKIKVSGWASPWEESPFALFSNKINRWIAENLEDNQYSVKRYIGTNDGDSDQVIRFFSFEIEINFENEEDKNYFQLIFNNEIKEFQLIRS